ncbi:MAG: hypothetical protein H0V88_04455 [Pyrinomonadaceae bacterium]|nr:hypothetical protein [Pyrinomonadaceae bacterium]
MKNLFLILLFSLKLSGLIAVAQQPPPLAPVNLNDFAEAKPTNCSHRTAALDGITQKTPADELIIVIARLGDSESRMNLSQRRLDNVLTYWVKYLPEVYRRKPETIVLAEGEKVKGFGQLEFYVGGKLVWVMKIERNVDLYVGECYPPDDNYIRNGVFDPCEVPENKIFYPCCDRYVRRKRRR